MKIHIMLRFILIIGLYLSLSFFTPITVESYKTSSAKASNFVSFKELPEYFSWKDHEGQDWTTPAKDQFEFSLCGVCAIFAGIGIIESVIKIKENYTGFNPDLSEQYILSCLPNAGNCKGSCDFLMYELIIDTGPDGNNCNGVVIESCFPYVGRDAEGYSNRFIESNLDPVPCSNKSDDWENYLVPLKTWGYMKINDTDDERDLIKQLIMDKGPIVSFFSYPMFPLKWNNNLGFFFNIIPFSFFYWGKMIHNQSSYFPASKTIFPNFGHAIAVVGWKDNSSIDNGGYWICKNSFGADWGYNGFVNLEYGILGHKDGTDYMSNYKSWVDYDPDSYKWPFESKL